MLYKVKRLKEPKGRLLIGTGMTNPQGMKIFGKPVARKLLTDSDMDTVPNFMDCQPRNPRKQGVLKWIGEKYQEYKAKEPERRQEKLQKMQYNLDVEKIRSQTEELRHRQSMGRLELQKKRVSLMQERQRALPKGMSLFSPIPQIQPYAKPTVRRVKRHRRKKKSKR